MDWWIFSWHYSTRHVHKIKWLSLLCPGVVGSFCMNLCQCIKHLHSKRSTQQPFGNWHPDGLIGNYWQSIDARPELATGTQYLFSLASNYSTFCWGETHKNMCLWMGVSPNGFALLLSFTPTPASHKPTKAVLILFKGLEKRREWSQLFTAAGLPIDQLISCAGPLPQFPHHLASVRQIDPQTAKFLLEVLPGGPCQSWSYKQGRKTDGSNYQEQTLQEFGRKTFQGVPTTLVGDLKPLSKETGLDTSLYRLNWKQWCLWERSQDKKHARMKHCIPKLLYPPGNEKSPPPIKTSITLPIISRSIETSILCLASAPRSAWSTGCFHQADCSNGPTPNETNPGRAWGINKTIPKLRVPVDSPNDKLTNGKIKRTWTKLRN